jgi:hypothetical protein
LKEQIMTRTIVATLGLSIATLLGVTPATAEIVETRELEESLAVSGREPLVVIVKNIFGPIRVTAHDRDRVEMHATETIRGDLQADIERARAEVALETQQEAGRVAFRVRHRGEDANCDCGARFDDYRVEYEIDLRVPREAAVELATVNDGDVTVEGVAGDFILRNVNGAVRLTNARGSGSVTTVNGKVEATFERAPTEPTSFKTVNGELDVTFPDSLAADFAFATMNGDVFTDFEVQNIASTPTQSSTQRGALVMRKSRDSAFRVGTGGPRHSFNTLNGDIFIRKAKP